MSKFLSNPLDAYRATCPYCSAHRAFEPIRTHQQRQFEPVRRQPPGAALSLGGPPSLVETTWDYRCYACGTAVELRVLADANPVKEIEMTRAGTRGVYTLDWKVVSRGTPYFTWDPYGAGRYGPDTTMSLDPAFAFPLDGADYKRHWIGEWPPDPPKPKPEPKPEPLRQINGSVIGYRAWKINHNTWQLAGTGGYGEDWVPGINEAVCATPGGHDAPEPSCHCGMYALARFDDGTSWWRRADVLGAVEAWADVDENDEDRFFLHSSGFRSQYAKPILLAVSDEYPRARNAAIRALASEYGADVCKKEHLEDAATEHGQLVPDELLEWAGKPDRWVPPPPDLSQRSIDSAVISRGVTRAEFINRLQSQATVYGNFFTPVAEATKNFETSMRRIAMATSLSPADFEKLRGEILALTNTKPVELDVQPLWTPRDKKGPALKTKSPGPPVSGKFRDGQWMLDGKRERWVCVKSGKPGAWIRA